MINLKSSTPLVESVLKLEHHLSEIVRLGGKIEERDLKTDFDFEQVQKLMTKFTQHGEGVAEEIAHFSALLGEARAKAEAAAQLVANRAISCRLVTIFANKNSKIFALWAKK